MTPRTALVTGASSGIGAAVARRLGAAGWRVGLVARREERLRAVAADCGTGARVWVADLGDLERAEAVALEAWDAFGHLDALVNNAGVPKRRPVAELTPAEIDDVMRVNFTSPVRMTLAVLPRMLERGAGTIVNVGSLGGRLGIAHEAAYCASKFALTGWSEAMHVDLTGTGVTVRLVQPGPVDTEIWDQPGSEAPRYDGPKVPADEVAEAIVGAIDGDRFEVFAPDLGAVVAAKTADVDGFLAGVAAALG